MWRIAMLTTAIGILMSVHGQVKADGLPPDVAGGSVEGTVRKVDVEAGTIQVSSGPLGLVGRTLQLSEDTLVKVGDREASSRRSSRDPRSPPTTRRGTGNTSRRTSTSSRSFACPSNPSASIRGSSSSPEESGHDDHRHAG
jgi:hypothetical protein